MLKLPLSKLCDVPLALQNRPLFEGERRAKRCLQKGKKGQKGKRGWVKTSQTWPRTAHVLPDWERASMQQLQWQWVLLIFSFSFVLFLLYSLLFSFWTAMPSAPGWEVWEQHFVEESSFGRSSEILGDDFRVRLLHFSYPWLQKEWRFRFGDKSVIIRPKEVATLWSLQKARRKTAMIAWTGQNYKHGQWRSWEEIEHKTETLSQWAVGCLCKGSIPKRERNLSMLWDGVRAVSSTSVSRT